MQSREALQKYIEAANSKDPDGIADLFAEECVFSDGAARQLGMQDITANGKDNIRAVYAGIFQMYGIEAKIVKMNENSMEYDVLLNGMCVPCIGAATVNDEGRITEYIVRAR